jgi:hypothetical protein
MPDIYDPGKVLLNSADFLTQKPGSGKDKDAGGMAAAKNIPPPQACRFMR